jgi:ADP-ribose pyrophosphatase YjhB (NUDIX family)
MAYCKIVDIKVAKINRIVPIRDIFSSLKYSKLAGKFSLPIMKLFTAGLLVIQDRKLLLAFSRNKDCFYLPGGKVDADESVEQALCREISEEMNVTLLPSDLRYYTHISAPAYGETVGMIMEQDCFLIHRPIQPVASSEIGELRYFSLSEYLEQNNTAPGAVMVLRQLKLDNLID